MKDTSACMPEKNSETNITFSFFCGSKLGLRPRHTFYMVDGTNVGGEDNEE